MNSFVSEDPFRYAAETLLSFLSRFEEQAAGIAPGADIEFLHRARVALCAATRQVLANGLALVGVSAPDRM